jgi:ribosomal protein S27AE
MKDNRPFLVDRYCGKCIVPLETTERHEDGWLHVTYACGKCGFRQVVTFSPFELQEWARRGRSRVTGTSWS